jgi:hypothetical protein
MLGSPQFQIALGRRCARLYRRRAGRPDAQAGAPPATSIETDELSAARGIARSFQA